MKTFDECKQEAAIANGFDSFWHLEQKYPKAIYRFYIEAAKIYAESAIRADREQIISSGLVDCDFFAESKKYEGYMLEDEIRKLPVNLP